MNIPLIILFFILGLLFGSFFTVVGLRVPQKIAFTTDRSMCPACSHPLSWYELVPVFSYILQDGKCRHCKRKISPIYPIVEIVSGFLFSYSFVMVGLTSEIIVALLLISMLLILFVSDIKYMLIPDSVLLFFLPLFIIIRIIYPLNPWWSAFTGGLIGLLVIYVVILVSRGGMGAGDMKLFGVLGLILGVKSVLLTFFLSCIIGAIVGMFLFSLKKVGRKQPIPFGPFIIVATFITYFYSDTLLYWYFNSLLGR